MSNVDKQVSRVRRIETVQYLDTMGRLHIPAKIRTSLGVKPNDAVVVAYADGQMTVSACEATCKVCNNNPVASDHQLSVINICLDCFNQMVDELSK